MGNCVAMGTLSYLYLVSLVLPYNYKAPWSMYIVIIWCYLNTMTNNKMTNISAHAMCLNQLLYYTKQQNIINLLQR